MGVAMSDLAYLFQKREFDLVTSIDESLKHDLLCGIESIGKVEAAAAELGITSAVVKKEMKNDRRFAADVQLARNRYKANLLRRMTDLAFNGSEVAIVGGRNRDQILGYNKVPDQKALELVARMNFSEELTNRHQVHADVTTDQGSVVTDFSVLDRESRKEVEHLFRRAQKILEDKSGEVLKDVSSKD